MKRTEGNWIHKEQMVYSESDNSGKTIANCNTEANARLIAAAPDLLKVVQDFSEWYANNYGDFNDEVNGQLYCLGHDADLAIAKADESESEVVG